MNECKQMKETEHVWCVSALLQKHVRAFLRGRTPDGIRGSAEWGVAMCDNGTGGHLFGLLGRVTYGWDEEMALNGLTVWILCFFFKKMFEMWIVNLSSLLTDEPKIIKKM